MAHYSATAGVSYMTNSHQPQYSPYHSGYPNYSPTYIPSSSSSQAAIHWPTTASSSMQYSVRPPPRSATLPSQHQMMSRNFFSPSRHTQRPPPLSIRTPMPLEFVLMDTEEQDSINRESMKSESIEPPLAGYPKVEDFDELMKKYVDQLSPKKQDKALIHARRASNIKTVLIDKKTTSIESAQFRFWVKKMFQLQPTDPSVPLARRKICHEGKPVAIREKLFKILTRAHQKCQHGGRDKTSAQVRRVYSWVPKELISRFVKLCPTCQIRRGMKGANDEADSGGEDNDVPDDMDSPVKSRRPSMPGTQDSNMADMPAQFVNSTSTFQNQNRWIEGFHPAHQPYETMYSPTSTLNNYEQTPSSQSGMPLSTVSNVSPTHSRPASSHQSRFKEAEYCYD